MIRGFEKISLEQYKKDKLDIKYYDDCIAPKRATKNSAGYDFYLLNDYVLGPNEIVKIPTGFKAYMQSDEVLFLIIRSSLGFKYNLRMCNQVGVIDSDYYNNSDNEGHIWVCIKNEGNETIKLNRGERFVQGIFTKYLKIDDDNTTNNRIGGIGSTNRGGN